MYVAMFSVLFGAFTAGQTMSFAPDVKKAQDAAMKIYSTIDLPSKIDALAESQNSAKPIPENFKGEIEFRDVWFRYPSRLQQWIFKGLNLKINHNEAIAIVGESGAGKSTFISLVMRFYDPEFGTVLIDGIDIKQYNINQLRMQMGLVMQEPTLFNYSIKENVLYGGQKKSNAQIIDAVEIANARSFVESSTLEHQISDEPAELLMNMKSENYKSDVIA